MADQPLSNWPIGGGEYPSPSRELVLLRELREQFHWVRGVLEGHGLRFDKVEHRLSKIELRLDALDAQLKLHFGEK